MSVVETNETLTPEIQGAAQTAAPEAPAAVSGAPTIDNAPAVPTLPAAPTPPAASADPAPELSPAESDRAEMLALLNKKQDAPTDPVAAAAATSASVPPNDQADAATGSQAEPGAEPAAEQDDPEAEEKPLSEDEQKQYGPAASKHIRRLLGRMSNLKKLRPDAQAYRNLTSYMAQNNLSGQEAAKGFEIMAVLKSGDPGAFLRAVMPYVEQAQLAAGQVLPEDLRAKVEQGYLDEETARETAQLRHRAKTAEVQRDTTAQHIQAAQSHHATQEIAGALNEWEAKLSTHPDYRAMKAAIHEFAVASFRAEPARDAREAVARVQAYFDKLRAPFADGGAARSARPIQQGPSSTLSPAKPPVRVPQSLAEQIEITLARRGAA
jgi:hypothetical protein